MSDSRTILIIDDEEPLRRLMARVLERAGYPTLTAGDGEDGLALYQERRAEVGLVVLDVVLPSLGAEALLPELLGLSPELPVILTSGEALPPSLEARLATMRGRFLRKPFAPAALTRLVTELATPEAGAAAGGSAGLGPPTREGG